MNDYQQKKLRSYVLPTAVYRQALWAVRDLGRMKEKLAALELAVDQVGGAIMDGIPCSRGGQPADRTGRLGGEMANLSMRIRTIERAIFVVPEQFRSGIISYLAYHVPYSETYHRNTWKKWQQVYLYQVAVDLMLL